MVHRSGRGHGCIGRDTTEHILILLQHSRDIHSRFTLHKWIFWLQHSQASRVGGDWLSHQALELKGRQGGWV
jgi:hypothetical protein